MQIRLAYLIIGQAKLSHAQRATFFQLIPPAMSEISGMVGYVCGGFVHIQGISQLHNLAKRKKEPPYAKAAPHRNHTPQFKCAR